MTDGRHERNGEAVRDLLPDWVAGRLRGDEARAVKEAVAADAALAAEADVLRSLLEGRPDPPDALAARITSAVRADRAEGRAGSGLPRWTLAAAAVAVLALGSLELAERSVTAGGAEGPLDRIALEDAPDPWAADGATIAGAPLLDGLSDEALSSLLEELGG